MLFERLFLFHLQEMITSSPWLMGLAIFCARWLILVFLVFALWLVSRKNRSQHHAAFEVLWAAVVALVFTSIFASLMGRVRPFLVVDAIYPIHALIPPPLNTSFPSGHTATSVAMAAIIFLAHRRLGWLAIGAATLIALGRMAVGVHYPTDLMGGIVVGLLAAWTVRFMHQQLRTRDLEPSVQSHHYS